MARKETLLICFVLRTGQVGVPKSLFQKRRGIDKHGCVRDE